MVQIFTIRHDSDSFLSVILKLDLHVYPINTVQNSSGIQKDNDILITMHFVGKHALIY